MRQSVLASPQRSPARRKSRVRPRARARPAPGSPDTVSTNPSPASAIPMPRRSFNARRSSSASSRASRAGRRAPSASSRYACRTNAAARPRFSPERTKRLALSSIRSRAPPKSPRMRAIPDVVDEHVADRHVGRNLHERLERLLEDEPWPDRARSAGPANLGDVQRRQNALGSLGEPAEQLDALFEALLRPVGLPQQPVSGAERSSTYWYQVGLHRARIAGTPHVVPWASAACNAGVNAVTASKPSFS